MTALLDVLKGKLAVLESPLASPTRTATSYLEKLYTFFPDAQPETVETVEY